MAEFNLGRIRFVWKGVWTSTTTYIKDDIVRYGGKTYLCVIGHTSDSDFYTDFNNVPTRWNQMSDGQDWKANWNTSTFYKNNDIVKYGGYLYICNTGHTSAATTTLGLEADQSKWDLFAESFDWKTNWNTSTRYKINDIVKYGGISYICNTGHTSAATATLGLEADQSKWDFLHKGIEYLGTWSGSSYRYKANDVVKYGAGTWICITPHTSSASFAEVNWEQFIEGLEFNDTWTASTVYQPGDTVAYGGYVYISKTNHSNQTPTSNSDDWDLYITGFRFVGTWGEPNFYEVGDVVRVTGYTYLTIQDHEASSGNRPPNPTYWSQLNSGQTWRGTWSSSQLYSLGEIVKYNANAYICILTHTSSTPNRPDNDTTSTYWNLYTAGDETAVLTTQGDTLYYGLSGPTRLPIGSPGQLLRASTSGVPEWAYFGVINKVYYVAPTGTDDTVANGWGTTLDRPWATVSYACSQVTGPATIFIKSGTYSEILPISVPANVALVGDELRSVTIQPAGGYTTSDMFYMRNATGLRNMTLQGLSGTLGSPNSYGTRRPSAGAYVSLDPGSGPSDTSVWITTRSPYIQNVTAFGTGCTGIKVDGSLHNGGNDSITANDFTQILSDGIGAWVTNLGRAELVSVFAYYNHIAYLAENGGKIRATNGNNSYGTYGSVSEGVDATETPITGQVDNKSIEAQIGLAVTDQINSIYRFEFTNAGVKYNNATFTINGPGINAVTVADEFRDDGVFEVRLTDPGDSSGFGGLGYKTASNTAQAGDATSITLAATDSEISSVYVGMRIVITSGTGVGQYGYIQAYNSGTKIATIYKETTGTAGWDHIIPGTTILSTLDVTTSYIIEPRLTFSSPGFAATARTLPSDTWNDVVFGNYSTTFTNVAATGGGVGALFTVLKSGNYYGVTLTTPGSGYQTNDVLTIPGTSLNASSPANDITITVLKVVGGGITVFEFDGTAEAGRYVAVTTGSTGSAYSVNGTVWQAGGALPVSGNWKVAYGKNNSVWVAINTAGTETAKSVNGGATWTSGGALPAGTWINVTYGNGRFVAIGTGTSAAYSTDDGATWVAMTSLPSATWTNVTYGAGLFVAVASSGTVAASSSNGTSWTSITIPSGNYVAVAFGKNKFVAIPASGTTAAFSNNGTTWGTMTVPSANYTDVAYGQGLFFAVSDSTTAATSEDGINWTTRTMSTAANGFSAVTFGNSNETGIWAAVQRGAAGTVASSVLTGCTTQARAFVSDEKITQIRIVESGSGYASAPALTITDPNNTVEATTQVRIGKGVLATPTFNNRGTGWTVASASVTGNGSADLYQTGSFIAFKKLSAIPKSGSNVRITGIDDVYYKLVSVTNLSTQGDFYTATLQISPPLGAAESPDHETASNIIIRYSQVRLTGHDFLDVGTGNITNTNYPNTPLIDPIPANETVENGGGRVFYTSTDQDGNFRVGDIFSVEQSTGIATLNADAFSIAGLQELQLGSVALGGSSATITEFSTDPLFTADSDNIVPTQRAVKAYISSQIGSGSSSLNVNSLTAGIIFVSNDTITTTTGGTININTKVNFRGSVDGYILAHNFFK